MHDSRFEVMSSHVQPCRQKTLCTGRSGSKYEKRQRTDENDEGFRQNNCFDPFYSNATGHRWDVSDFPTGVTLQQQEHSPGEKTLGDRSTSSAISSSDEVGYGSGIENTWTGLGTYWDALPTSAMAPTITGPLDFQYSDPIPNALELPHWSPSLNLNLNEPMALGNSNSIPCEGSPIPAEVYRTDTGLCDPFYNDFSAWNMINVDQNSSSAQSRINSTVTNIGEVNQGAGLVQNLLSPASAEDENLSQSQYTPMPEFSAGSSAQTMGLATEEEIAPGLYADSFGGLASIWGAKPLSEADMWQFTALQPPKSSNVSSLCSFPLIENPSLPSNDFPKRCDAEEPRLNNLSNKWCNVTSSDPDPYEAIKHMEGPRKKGRRSSQLSPAAAKKAAELRRIGSCFRCSIRKIPCSLGETCTPCRLLGVGDVTKPLCTRKNLADYTALFFPGKLVDHLRRGAVNAIMSQLSLGFASRNIEIEVSCDGVNMPMNLIAAEFLPAGSFYSKPPIVDPRINAGSTIFENHHPFPIALRDISDSTLRKCWLEYIEALVGSRKDLDKMVLCDMCRISQRVLELVCRYHASNLPPEERHLLDNAMALYSMFYFMGSVLKLTESSLDRIARRIQKPTIEKYGSSAVSRPLNRQLKYALHGLIQERLREVLKELEKSLRTRDKSTWGVAFCVVSILCVCMEEVQISLDGFVMHANVNRIMPDVPSPSYVINKCRELDEFPYAHMTSLFHGVFKTEKIFGSRFNNDTSDRIRSSRPRNEPNADCTDIGNTVLIRDIRQVLLVYDTEVRERAKTPPSSSTESSYAEHIAFRKKNSARLVSRFLSTF